MSITEQVERLDVDLDELASRIAKDTIPGSSNKPYERGIVNSSAVVPVVIEDLNNWFEIMEVRILDQYTISMPMRYRWSIVRWARQDMDAWLMDRGWENFPHRRADTHVRDEDELEARYRKEFGDVTVYCNFLVHFPPEVFRELNNRTDKNMKKGKSKSADLKDVVEARRQEDV